MECSKSHIVPLLVGDSKLCKELSELLLQRFSIYVQPINYPTVARGSERFRLTPTPIHTKDDIEHLISSLVELWKEKVWKREGEIVQVEVEERSTPIHTNGYSITQTAAHLAQAIAAH